MRRVRSLLVLLACGLGACASTATAPPQPPSTAEPPELGVATALEALGRGEFAAAIDVLAEAWQSCPGGEWGERALLVGVAVALDPRNPSRDASQAIQLAASYLRSRPDASWGGPVVEAFYLIGLELGASSKAQGADDQETSANGSSGQVAADSVVDSGTSVAGRTSSLCEPKVIPVHGRPLPELPTVPLADRASALERERQQLLRRVQSLEAAVAAQERELERVRRTLDP